MATTLEADRVAIPQVFCWSKFGTEAGEPIEEIRARKERERQEGGGLFLWGIGNSIAPSIKLLVDVDPRPSVLFTPMLSRAAQIDVRPAGVVQWRSGLGLDGRPHQVPDHCQVTSRTSGGSARPRAHYALVCSSENPIDVDETGAQFSRGDVVNFASGSPVGSSQVTAVVERSGPADVCGTGYAVSFRATLVYPYVLRLTVSHGPGDAVVGRAGAHTPTLW